MIYANDKLRIVPFERERHMTEIYRSWFHDPEVTKYNSHGLFPYTKAAMEAFVRDVEQDSTSRIVWAVEILNPRGSSDINREYAYRKEHNLEVDSLYIHIGNVSLQSINWINRSAELAVVLGRERGKGHGLQACRWALEHAFDRLGMNRVWTGTAATNAGMRAVCAKLGMAQEGAFKDGVFLDGCFEDVIAYGITEKTYDGGQQ